MDCGTFERSVFGALQSRLLPPVLIFLHFSVPSSSLWYGPLELRVIRMVGTSLTASSER